ncbi:MAG: ribosomal protein S18-alanine N-acetyltransferase [Gemmatimonadaceae bacterium]|nr:ribosomal protein S18-alanine N-acetyltransferase [Gemmatimonadaceae bacterium]
MSAFANVTLTVRRCVPADLDAMASIERVSFSDPWSFETLSAAHALRHMRVLVAEESGRASGEGGAAPVLVGYVLALVMADEGEIADVAVAPDARGRGVARALLDQIILDMVADGVRALYLEVRESNAAARGLYRSLDFVQVGRRRGYYQHPNEDALLLRRDLVPS